MVWPGGNNMLYSMGWLARYGIWYGLTGMAWYMLWPGGMGWYVVWPGGNTWYSLWSGGHDMVYGMDLRAWHVAWYSIMV